MELRQLRYFVEIAEQGSFTRAAETLSIAQPALTTQVQKLEAELRAPLFLRNKRGITLDWERDTSQSLLRELALSAQVVLASPLPPMTKTRASCLDSRPASRSR